MALPSLGCSDVSSLVGRYKMKKLFPWWGKVIIKLLIGLIPIPYEKIRTLVTGLRGGMESPEYAKSIFHKFSQQPSFQSDKLQGGTLLELGPGGSLLTGFFAKAQGFRKCILIDVGNFAIPDKKIYASMAYLLPPPDQKAFETKLAEGAPILEALEVIEIHYYTSGIESFKKIPDNSIDFSFSNAVLEHVKKNHFKELLSALYRVHKRGSVSAHQVDYKDHLGGSLNNLRFSQKIWESKYFANDGFYTNRLRHSQIIGYAKDTGFDVVQEELSVWDVLPLNPISLATEFRILDERDLRTNGVLMSLQKPI